MTAASVTVGQTIVFRTRSNAARKGMYVEKVRPSATGGSVVLTGRRVRVSDGAWLQQFACELLPLDAEVVIL